MLRFRGVCDCSKSFWLTLVSAAILHVTPSSALASRAPAEVVLPIPDRAANVRYSTAKVLRLAANKDTKKSSDENEVETEDIFGFMSGSDLPEKGNKEGELEFVGARGKKDGSYTALTKELALKYMALPDTLFAVSGAMAYHSISGVTGLEDRDTVSPQSLGFEVKHRLLDRTKVPFGLAISARPSWARIDEVSGEPVSQFGTGFKLIADKELVKDRLFGAVNLLYDFAGFRVLDTGEWERESSIGIAAAASWQFRPRFFVGAEARYFRAYEGLGLNRFSGQAVFLGPTAFAKLSKFCFIAAAWNIQAWGREHGGAGSFDLANFERHQFTLKLGFEM